MYWHICSKFCYGWIDDREALAMAADAVEYKFYVKVSMLRRFLLSYKIVVYFGTLIRWYR